MFNIMSLYFFMQIIIIILMDERIRVQTNRKLITDIR